MVINENRSLLGIDIGSTTIKIAVVHDNKLVYRLYRRHNSDIRNELLACLEETRQVFPGVRFCAAVTGSGGMSAAGWLGLDFIQEVVAGTFAAQTAYPDTDVIIELGGEDAKITFLKPGIEQRMNGTCAGGTGAFIDQMASLLQTDASGLNELAKNSRNKYTIASRCGVFISTVLSEFVEP